MNYLASAVSVKLERYAKNDIDRIGYSGDFPLEDAIKMVRDTNGICPDCGVEMKMTRWNRGDKTQFSFDRINDHAPHSAYNCRVTCLGCNINKALADYKPTEYFAAYDEVKSIFFKLKAYFKSLMPYRADPGTKAICYDLLSSIRKIETTLFQLHPIAFGTTKRDNAWKDYGTPFARLDHSKKDESVATILRRIRNYASLYLTE